MPIVAYRCASMLDLLRLPQFGERLVGTVHCSRARRPSSPAGRNRAWPAGSRSSYSVTAAFGSCPTPSRSSQVAAAAGPCWATSRRCPARAAGCRSRPARARRSPRPAPRVGRRAEPAYLAADQRRCRSRSTVINSSPIDGRYTRRSAITSRIGHDRRGRRQQDQEDQKSVGCQSGTRAGTSTPESRAPAAPPATRSPGDRTMVSDGGMS